MDKPHKKLNVWKKSMELVLMVYKVTKKFPDEEKFSLTFQIRRSSISVPSNIAEGATRNTKKDFNNFLNIAQSSLSELDTQMELSKNIGYIGKKTYNEIDSIMENVDKMLSGLIRFNKSPHF